MIITIPEARKILGETASKYTDAQIEEIINVFVFFTDLAIDSYIDSKKGKDKEVITNV